jgi:hypothetical protein
MLQYLMQSIRVPSNVVLHPSRKRTRNIARPRKLQSRFCPTGFCQKRSCERQSVILATIGVDALCHLTTPPQLDQRKNCHQYQRYSQRIGAAMVSPEEFHQVSIITSTEMQRSAGALDKENGVKMSGSSIHTPSQRMKHTRHKAIIKL